MKKIIFIFCLFFSLFSSSYAADALVQDIFSDISVDYQYRDELQALYDRGMIVPDGSGKFSPDAYLNRDEFVGISMEVICERCIAPHTELKFLEKYANKDVYFDIDSINPYFYCVAEADDKNYVRGYDISQTCENGTTMFGERPFCPLNRINKEEAIAVLLRNSGIFTIEDNQQIISNIINNTVTQTLGNDVNPKDINGNPYTFYGYIEKALSYEITEYDTSGSAKTLRLLELDAAGNINPKSSVTKEEFLRMSYIALKSNSCSEISDKELALQMHIWEKSCSAGDENCELSDLNDPEDVYDFTPEVEGFCEGGIQDPSGYVWRFINLNNGDEFFHYGTYLDNIAFPSIGQWRIYLTVRDNCGNTGQIYSTLIVEQITSPGPQEIDVDIDVFDDNCTGPTANCIEIEFSDEGDDGDDIFDFDGDVSTTCEIGTIDYVWTFSQGGVSRFTFTTEYIDNFEFLTPGVWNILLEVEDGCGQTGSEQMTYLVEEEPYIVVLPPDCNAYPCSQGVIPPVTVCDGSVCIPVVIAPNCQIGQNCDYTVDPPGQCQSGILSYAWTFTNIQTNEIINRSGEYINNFSFLTQGRWRVHVDIVDNCGESFEDDVYVDVGPNLGPYINTIDIDIDVFDDACTGSNAGCTEIQFADEEDDGDNIFDFDGDVSTTCEIGTIDYVWTFTHASGRNFNFSTEFVDNFYFMTPGVWNILLEVEDGCGQTGSEQMTYIVPPDVETTLNVTIEADPISGYRNLEVDFEGIISGGIGPFTYDWNFGDGTSGTGPNTQHLYETVGIYEVILTVTDSEGRTGTATVLIQVLDADTCLQDTDNDGIVDCEDSCPFVAGSILNNGCPILESSCSVSCGCEPGYECSDNNPLTCGAGMCLPSFEPRTTCLFTPSIGGIFGNAVCNSCPCDVEVDFLAAIRKCDLVFPAITSPDATEIYSQGRAWEVQ